MGQKVHPLGFRVGITKKHQSQWFARFNKYAYSQSVVEDNMLRNTLMSIFPELLNPVLKKMNKRMSDKSETPKITQIKIERGLIPYEIGIQIHAENCDFIKGALDNLKINRDLVCNLQKTRKYLQKLSGVFENAGLGGPLSKPNSKSAKKKRNNEVYHAKKADSRFKKNEKRGNFKYKSKQSFARLGLKSIVSTFVLNGAKAIFGNNKKLSAYRGVNKKALRVSKVTKPKSKTLQSRRRIQKVKALRGFVTKRKALRKRLKRRERILNAYKLFIRKKGLFIQKRGNTIFRKVTLKRKKLVSAYKVSNAKIQKTGSKMPSRALSKDSSVAIPPKKKFLTTTGNGVYKQLNKPFNKIIKKKFVSLFLKKMNRNFLSHLKQILRYWNEQALTREETALSRESGKLTSSGNFAPLGYSPKWNLNRLKTLKKQPLSKLTKLVALLEKKCLTKTESLKKDFICFGSVSKTRGFGYYQIITFLKHLKKLVSKVQKQSLKYTESKSVKVSANSKSKSTSLAKILNKTKKPFYEIALRKVLNNVYTECRKFKFIEYLKEIVRKHRTENIYYYLPTIADARKELKGLKRFTKEHANFLFGLDANTLSKENTQMIQDKITKLIDQSTKKTDLEKDLQDAFLLQIENQRNMAKANLSLTPKISIKFFTVKSKNVKTKASVVAESIVDALEKRQAFRKAIKSSKESLMLNASVKGVKIQVAGRLNGAEIARSEWVRAGRVPLQTLRANIDYSYRTANTIYGIIGVKVWIFKGYTKA